MKCMSFPLEVKLFFIKIQTLNKKGSCYICSHKSHFIVFLWCVDAFFNGFRF